MTVGTPEVTMAPLPPVESERGADCLDDALASADATVAVVAAPFAGREAVLDRVEAALDDPARVHVAPEEPTLPDPDGPLLLDDCHHYYRHRIGGFDALDDALDRLATSTDRVVTSWNRHSWNYLDAVRDLSGAFGHVFAIPPLSADAIADAVRSSVDAWPTFEHSADGRASPVTSVECRVPVPLSAREPLVIRVPTVDVDYVSGWLRGREPPTAKALVFERLTRLVDGNPGVATAVWDGHLAGTETLTPADVSLPVERELDLGDDEARVAGVLVPKEVVTRSELAAVVPDVALDRTLRSLADRGIAAGDDPVRLRPGGLPSAADSLERRRWLW
jgi:hypothetical protein